MNTKYIDIIKEVGAQLNLRKKSIFARTLLIIWPILLGIGVFYLLSNMYRAETVKTMVLAYPYWIMLLVYIIFSLFYISIIGYIFEIEKRIWVDSFFDNKQITPKESWNISKRLFWPAFVFRLKIQIRYYLIPTIIFLVVVGLALQSLLSKGIGSTVGGFPIGVGILILAVVGIIVYQYYLRIKLRFSWFLFLDTYKGGKVDQKNIIDLMNKLNSVAKSEGFKKALVLAVGTDSAKAIIKSVIEIMTNGISNIVGSIPNSGNLGKAVGDMTKVYGDSVAEQFASYAEIVSMYILYRVARKEVYSTEQETNEYIYGLK